MNLKSLFNKNPYIIINTDIDGILSGIILVKYCNCKIVGFTNSKDSVWLADGYDDLYKHVYIDMFVTDDNTICIDQHIVALNDNHMKKIISLGNKYSPQNDDENNLRIFTALGFKYKYPFGTLQYLIAQLESEGIKINLPDLNTPVPNSEITIGDLIHRADDAMQTTMYAYESNANFWWDWLDKKAPKGSIKVMRSYLDQLKISSDAKVDAIPTKDGKKHKKKDYSDQRAKDVDCIKSKTIEYFKSKFNCNTSDGGFNEITDNEHNLLPNIEQYIKTISSLFEIKDITIYKHYNVHKGTACRTRWLDIFKDDFLKNYTICGHKIFSYAFIYGPENDRKTNFSFTIDMK